MAGFIGAPAMNFLPAGELRAAHPEAAVVAGIRPQHLRLAGSGEPGAIEAEVRLVEALGTETVVHGATPSGERVLAVLPGQAALAPGARIRLASEPGAPALLRRRGPADLISEGAEVALLGRDGPRPLPEVGLIEARGWPNPWLRRRCAMCATCAAELSA